MNSIKSILEVVLISGSTLIVIEFFLQLVIAPKMAIARGKDGAAWFMIALMWCLMNATFLFVQIAMFASGITATAIPIAEALTRQLRTSEIALFMVVIFVSVLAFCAFSIYMLLPVVVLWISSGVKQQIVRIDRRLTRRAEESQPDHSFDSTSSSTGQPSRHGRRLP